MLRFTTWMVVGQILWLLLAPVSLSHGLAPGEAGVVSPVAAAPLGADAMAWEKLGITTTLWSDRHGDYLVEQDLVNDGATPLLGQTWRYGRFPSGYTEVHAWDDDGPLQISTLGSPSGVDVTVMFRRPLAPGGRYRFSHQITFPGVTSAGELRNYVVTWGPFGKLREFAHRIVLPANATVETVSPQPTTTQSNVLVWRLQDPNIWWYETFDVSFRPGTALEVPLLLQSDGSWGGQVYGRFAPWDGGNNVIRWGSFLTSAAMVVNFWGARQAPAFTTDPGKLNAWLREHGGYDPNHMVVEPAVATYARASKVQLSFELARPGADDALVQRYLSSGVPVILGVGSRVDAMTGKSYPNHFVVATGRIQQGGVQTYTILDPMFGASTLADRWNNQYNGMVVFVGTALDPQVLRFAAERPEVALMLTAPDGRQTGFDVPAGVWRQQIPDASYWLQGLASLGDTTNGPFLFGRSLLVPSPDCGAYKVTATTSQAGPFVLDGVSSRWDAGLAWRTWSTETSSASSALVTVPACAAMGIAPRSSLPLATR